MSEARFSQGTRRSTSKGTGSTNPGGEGYRAGIGKRKEGHRRQELSLDARKVKTDSTAKEDPLKAATALLLGLVRVEGQFFFTLPLTVVSGGPKTPREQSAVQLAIAKAIQPWIAIHPQNKQIDTGE